MSIFTSGFPIAYTGLPMNLRMYDMSLPKVKYLEKLMSTSVCTDNFFIQFFHRKIKGSRLLNFSLTPRLSIVGTVSFSSTLVRLEKKVLSCAAIFFIIICDFYYLNRVTVPRNENISALMYSPLTVHIYVSCWHG